MSDILSSYEFTKGPRPKVFNIEAFADGKIHRLARGFDFSCSTEAMRQRLYRHAKQTGMKAQVAIESSLHLVVQFSE